MGIGRLIKIIVPITNRGTKSAISGGENVEKAILIIELIVMVIVAVPIAFVSLLLFAVEIARLRAEDPNRELTKDEWRLY